MENPHNLLLSWAYFCQGKGMEELRQTLMLTAMELENTRIKVQEELKMKDDQLLQLNDLLNRTIKQRDEAQEKCRKLLFENLMLQQHQQLQLQQHQNQHQHQQSGPTSGVSSIEDEPRKGVDSNNGFSSSDCDESIVSSPAVEAIPSTQMATKTAAEQEFSLPIVPTKPLPEEGKLLQAVMKAGPLLQTLLLAGPLPQWRHPPPPLDTYEIPPPPVVIPSSPPPILPMHSLHQLNLTSFNNSINNCGRLDRKSGFSDDSDSSSAAKYQRLVLQ